MQDLAVCRVADIAEIRSGMQSITSAGCHSSQHMSLQEKPNSISTCLCSRLRVLGVVWGPEMA